MGEQEHTVLGYLGEINVQQAEWWCWFELLCFLGNICSACQLHSVKNDHFWIVLKSYLCLVSPR